MSDVHVKPKIDPQLGPVEALGVALSIPMSNTEMIRCQELAKPMLDHLNRIGWFLVRNDSPLKEDRDELRAIRDEIRLRSEVLRAFPDESPDSECDAQRERFSWLLRRERELMGEEWVANG